MAQARYRTAPTNQLLHLALRRTGQSAGELLGLTSMAAGLLTGLLLAASLIIGP